MLNIPIHPVVTTHVTNGMEVALGLRIAPKPRLQPRTKLQTQLACRHRRGRGMCSRRVSVAPITGGCLAVVEDSDYSSSSQG